MNFKIAVLPGDGIGPEISAQGVDVMSAVCERFGHDVEYSYALCGADAIDRTGDPFPEETFRTCLWADAVLFSAVGDPRFDNDPTAKVRPEQGLLAMRKKLGLFANIRPVETFDCLIHMSPLRKEIIEGADFVCIRELTGGMYFGEKFESDDRAYDTNAYTRTEIERILRVAYAYAGRRRKHLTVVDKANVLASSRLWRKVAQEMAPQYPDITTDYMYVDNAAMRMIQDPRFFDVIVTETPSVTSSPTKAPSYQAPWGFFRQHQQAKRHQYSNPYTAPGHKPKGKTSLTPSHRSSQLQCCSSTSASLRRARRSGRL